TAVELDEDVGQLTQTLDEYYAAPATAPVMPPGLDGALQAIFEDADAETGDSRPGQMKSAAELIHRLRPELAAAVFRWTGHFPERTRPLVTHLERRAADLKLVYPASREEKVIVAVTCLVFSLA